MKTQLPKPFVLDETPPAKPATAQQASPFTKAGDKPGQFQVESDAYEVWESGHISGTEFLGDRMYYHEEGEAALVARERWQQQAKVKKYWAVDICGAVHLVAPDAITISILDRQQMRAVLQQVLAKLSPVERAAVKMLGGAE